MFHLYDIKMLLLAIFGIFMVLKTFHFWAFIKRRNVITWFYFGAPAIRNSTSPKSAEAKRMQNRLTFIISAVIFCYLMLLFVTSESNASTLTDVNF